MESFLYERHRHNNHSRCGRNFGISRHVTTKQTGLYSDEAPSSYACQISGAGSDHGNYWENDSDQNDGAAVITSGQSAQPAFQLASSSHARGSTGSSAGAVATRAPSNPVAEHNKEDDIDEADATDEAQSCQTRDANGHLDKDASPDKDAPAPDKEVDEQTLPQSPEHDKDGDPVDGSDHDKDGGTPTEGGQPAQTDYSGMHDKDGGAANPQPGDFDKD